MPLKAKPSRTRKTEQHYRIRVRQLIGHCRKKLALGAHTTIDYRQFVGWLVMMRPSWDRLTWRQYKAAVVFFLETESASGDSVADEALEFILPIGSDGCLKKSMRTSARKMKKVAAKDFKKIMTLLNESNSRWRSDLERWVVAGLLTGLRPIEWGESRITTINGDEALIVVNAKATNDRSHGDERIIFLNGLNDDERSIIATHVARANEWHQAAQYDTFYRSCSALLARLVSDGWPNRSMRITLYSFRHQFSANAKASGFSREELAAMMGHAVDTTASIHYGKKTAGYDLVRVRPDPGDVQKVRKIFQQKFTAPSPKIRPEILMKPEPENKSG